MFFSIGLLFPSIAQRDCGTITPANPFIITQKLKDSLNTIKTPNVNNYYLIRIQINVFANDDGSKLAASNKDILRQFQNMANQYAAHNIYFTLMEIKQYNNTDLNNHNASTEYDELNPYRRANCFNIFIHDNLIDDSGGLNGTAYMIPNTNFDISEWGGAITSTTNLTVMGHELGHALGLYHTFESFRGTRKEKVDRSGSCKNCDNNGDNLCDTPADLDIDVNNACEYIGTKLDACGAAYTPMTNNIMAYGPRECRTVFTSGQGENMRYWLQQPQFQSIVAQNILLLPSDNNLRLSYSIGNSIFTAVDFIGICQFNNNNYNVSGTATQQISAKRISLKSGTKLQPSSGRIQITGTPN